MSRQRLDAITNEDVQRLKHRLQNKAIRTVNNVLSVLSMTLKKAVEWQAIEHMPCTVRLLKVPQGALGFYDFEEYESLVKAAATSDHTHSWSYCSAAMRGYAAAKCARSSGP